MSKAPIDHFNYIQDEVLIEMAQHYPVELQRLCLLISLDIQFEIERSKTPPN